MPAMLDAAPDTVPDAARGAADASGISHAGPSQLTSVKPSITSYSIRESEWRADAAWSVFFIT